MSTLYILGSGTPTPTAERFGSSYVPTSFMTNAPEWILIGLVTAAAGITIVVRSVRR